MEAFLKVHQDALSGTIVIFGGGTEKQGPNASFRVHKLVILVKQTRGKENNIPHRSVLKYRTVARGVSINY